MRDLFRYGGYLILAGSLGALGGCGGGGGGSSAPAAEAPEPADDTAIATINDPFFEHQWYLYNTGQAALTVSGDGGQANGEGEFADIRIINSNTNDADAYAMGYSGEGVKIAVIDNGLEIGHEDLSDNITANASYNFFSDSNGKGLHDPTATNDVDNPNGYHGTSVAGIVAARGGNDIGIWGVAPSAELVGYNLLYGAFNLTDELAAIGHSDSVDSYSELYSESIDVFNMSYGRNPYQGTNENPAYSPEIIAGLKAGTETLRSGKGAIYVKAAGNEFYGGAAFGTSWCEQAQDNNVTCYNTNMENENVTPYQMIIGAFNADDERASYSNTGSALWMVAPGGEFGVNYPALISTDQSGCTYGFSQNESNDYPYNLSPFDSDFNTGVNGTDNESCNYFSAFNGSSASTPIISGIAALMLEAYPALKWRDVKHILATTARQLDANRADTIKDLDAGPGTDNVTLEAGWVTNDAGYHYSNHYGFGAPDTNAALQMTLDWKVGGTHLDDLQMTAELSGTVPANADIPDYDSTGLSATVNVADNLVTESVELVISIDDLNGTTTDSTTNKIDMSDYQIVLRSPAGTESVLLTPYNAYESGHDMVDLKLISHAFYGEASQGNWTLIVRDLDNTDDYSPKNRIAHVGEGKLTEWTLKVYGH